MQRDRRDDRRMACWSAAGCFVLLLGMLAPLAVRAQADPPRRQAVADRERFFESEVRPLLVKRCYKCHAGKEHKGGLQLDSRSAVTKGGDSGPAVVPGNLSESLLIEAVEYEGFEMPPDGRLGEREVAVLKRWVAEGAVWPHAAGDGRVTRPTAGDRMRAEIDRVAESHWAFQPVVAPEIPLDDQDQWSRNEIDRFVWRRLTQSGLQPSSRADRRTLLRRAFLDLIGMPPTPEEARRFLADRSPDAYARLIDQLLEDPRYGERWGRHWLDVARYADSKGAIFGEPREYLFAYTYRDYVIESFNRDKPFDRFLREQLAADQLTDRSDDPSLAALGFLTVHRRANGGGEEAQWVDRVDTVTRGMLALTVACARCHDHKYDPVPTEDFYSLMGVFASIEEPKEFPVIGRPPAGSPLEQSYREFVAEEDRKREEFITQNHQKIMRRVRGELGRYLLVVHDGRDLEDGKLQVLAGRRKLNPYIAQRWKAYLASRPNDAVFGAWQAFAELAEESFAEQVPQLTARIGANELANCQLNPLVAEAFQNASPKSLGDVAEIYQQLFGRIDTEWQAYLAATPEGESRSAFPDADREQLRRCLYGEDAPGVMPARDFKMLDRQAYLRLLRVEADRKLRLALHPGSPRRAMVVRDKESLYQPYVFLRGNKDRRGPSVPRRFLSLLTGADRRPFVHGSGRLELADAIVARDNPLTPRVIVNRVWLWHFGRGLVTTPSDFGLRADPPSHPQLLDFLASTLVAEGWSLKSLHRRIMNSATYQQSSHNDAAKFSLDPDNRLLWRYNRRRLDYEAIHDSMLAVSGKLDSTRSGPAVKMIHDAGWEKIANNQTNWQFNPYRRAVYGVIDRDKLPPLLPTFDFASPDETAATRDITTVPTQSLYLLNSDFVMELAEALATRSDSKQATDPRERVKRMYELVFGREPTRRETDLAIDFIQSPVSQAESRPSHRSPADSIWSFGYASYDVRTGRHDLASLKAFPFLGTGVMQGSAEYPDKKNKFGWLKLTPAGGHAAGSNRCVIRRWTSPIDGVVRLSGTLVHPAEQGNGVQATIYGPAGRVGQWSAHHRRVKTEVPRVRVRVGDRIDFVVDCKGDGGYDGFQWAPVVTTIDGRSNWSSRRAFPRPKSERVVSDMSVWARYAQVLLMSNEFMFIE